MIKQIYIRFKAKVHFNKKWSEVNNNLSKACYLAGYTWPAFLCWLISKTYKYNFPILATPILYLSDNTTYRHQWEEAKEYLDYVKEK